MFLPIQSEYVYLERWYIEKDTVRTRVTLARGAVTPMQNKLKVSQMASNVLHRHRSDVGAYLYVLRL